MIVKQTGIFKRNVKKMYKQEKAALDEAVEQIMGDPSLGEMKVGDLAVVQFFKYKHNVQLYLLAYEYLENELVLTLIGHGSHENFYRDLKRS
jgi:mRNA interferase RelE/StbE